MLCGCGGQDPNPKRDGRPTQAAHRRAGQAVGGGGVCVPQGGVRSACEEITAVRAHGCEARKPPGVARWRGRRQGAPGATGTFPFGGPPSLRASRTKQP
eukprot:scaffold4211_cov112-Isochrysis_galbana.AAC.1